MKRGLVFNQAAHWSLKLPKWVRVRTNIEVLGRVKVLLGNVVFGMRVDANTITGELFALQEFSTNNARVPLVRFEHGNGIIRKVVGQNEFSVAVNILAGYQAARVSQCHAIILH